MFGQSITENVVEMQRLLMVIGLESDQKKRSKLISKGQNYMQLISDELHKIVKLIGQEEIR